MVGPEFDGLHVSQEFPTFSIDISLAEPRYVRYLAQWNSLHSMLKDKGTGVGSRRQRVSVDRLLSTTVPLPDLNEQGRVAGRLDSIFTKYSALWIYMAAALTSRTLLRSRSSLPALGWQPSHSP